MSNKQILLAGLHGSGKTTFIAALWYAINNSSSTSLKVSTLKGGNFEYLYDMALKWSKFENVSRTNLNENVTNEITLQNRFTQDLLNLKVPDLSGETYRLHFETRQWEKEFDDLLTDTKGLLLFIDPTNKNNVPKFIYDANRLEQILGVQPENGEQEIILWDYKFVPNQVKLVDTLQFLIFQKRDLLPLKIGIVISAWDRILESQPPPTPKQWFEINMPLLFQFLKSNPEYFVYKEFGVSAQGCDYTNKEKRDDLASRNPLERILVQDELTNSHDISSPIMWILDENNN